MNWRSPTPLALWRMLLFFFEDVPLVEFMNLVFTRIPGENSCSRLRSLLSYSCDVFQALNSLPLFTGSAGIYRDCLLVRRFGRDL